MMIDVPEHTTMKLYDAAGRNLITDAIALGISRLVFIEVFGQADFDHQTPLAVRDEGKTWIVEGSRQYDYASQSEDQLVHGRALIEIVKRNGAIVRLSKMVDFPQSPIDRAENVPG